MKRIGMAALSVTAALSAHAGDDERESMIPPCVSAVRTETTIYMAVTMVFSPARLVTIVPNFGFRLLHSEEDFAVRTARIEFATRDDHGTFLHHSAECHFWHRRLSGISIDDHVGGQIILD